jgi:4-hydroxy-2-oxoglutarate aldolase
MVQVLAGSASFLLTSMAMGAVGGVCALANIAPQPLLDLITAFKAGDMEKATELQLRMIAPNMVCL